MTNPEYILDFMRDGDFRFYIVSNGYDADVVRQMAPTTCEESIEKLSKFFNNTTGMYRVKLYRTNELTRQGIPREDPQIFEVTLDGKKIGSRKQEEENPMMGGVDELNSYNPFSGAGAGYGGDYGGMFGVDTYMAQTREIMELKEKIKALEHKLEMTEFTHKHEMTRLFDKHRQELKEAKDGNALLGQGLGALMSKMGLDGE